MADLEVEKEEFYIVTRAKRVRNFCDHAHKCSETTPHRGASNAQVRVEASKTLHSTETVLARRSVFLVKLTLINAILTVIK